jgi:NAD+ synthase (glutamine-hydrolysing)
MKIALLQVNSTIADFQGNAEKMLALAEGAAAAGADLAVFPELCVCGYPPLDLLDQERFTDECLKAVRAFQRRSPAKLGAVIGYIDKNRTGKGKALVNAVSLIHENRILFTQTKTLLPTYDVFDEARYFEPAARRRVFEFRGVKIGIAICEDVWWEQERSAVLQYPVDPVKELLDLGAGLLLVPSASPFYSGKPAVRRNLALDISRSSGVPVCYVNLVGGNDSLIFDGQSFYVSPRGRLEAAAAAFAEDTLIVDTEKPMKPAAPPLGKYEEIERALVLGIKDYLAKCGFRRVHLGLSGGIDSALVAVLATRAVGRENVRAFALPSRFSSPASLADARQLAANLGVGLEVVSIESIFPRLLEALAPVFAGKAPDVTEENVQARIRSLILMAYANKFDSVLLNTGNKSELATGYCTLYGDMCGSLAVIGDLFKTEVYGLARDINRRGPVIPEAIIAKAPTAELKENQTDQDTLPPYELLDLILEDLLLRNLSVDEICEKGRERAMVEKVVKMVGRAEYKRRQAPPVLKVSPRAFGMGRRMPIARHFFELRPAPESGAR